MDQTDSSNDESVSINEVIDDLLKPSNDEGSVEVLNVIEQFYSTGDTGEKIDDKLAGVLSKMLRQQPSDVKMIEKLNSFKRPLNIAELEPTRVNPEIWSSLQSKTRSLDIKIQKVEQAMLKSMVPIISCVELLLKNDKCDQKTLITKLLDSVAIISHSNHELNLRRRELIKPDLNRQFASLCSSQVPITGLLFGDNLSQKCKDIQETNKLGQKFGLRSGSSVGSIQGHGKLQRRWGDKSSNRSGQYRQHLNSSRPLRGSQRKKWVEHREPAAAK